MNGVPVKNDSAAYKAYAGSNAVAASKAASSAKTTPWGDNSPGKYADGTTIGNLATTGTGGGPLGTVTEGNNVYKSPGWGGGSLPSQRAEAAKPVAKVYDIQGQIEALKASQIAAATASLGKARDSSLSNLSADRAKIDPAYYSARNQASTSSQLGAKNFAEFLSQRGQSSSGVANQGEISSNVALQGQYGSLKTAQMGEEADNTRQVTNVNNGYASDLASAEAGAESTALQNTISQMNSDRAFAQANKQYDQTYELQKADTTGNFQGEATMAKTQADLAASQFQQQFGLTVAQAMGDYEGNPTLAKQAQQIQQAQFAAAQSIQNTQYYAGLNQNQSQYNATAAQGNYEFGASLGQNKSQFDQNLANNKYQYGATQAQQQNQFNSTLAQSGYQFGVTSGISKQNADTAAYSAGVGSGSGAYSGNANYDSWINSAATANNLDPSLLAGLIKVESNFNPNAVNKSSGATGFGQFLASTAKDEGLVDRTDPKTSIYAAAAYLAKRISWAGGNVSKGVMGYGENTTAYLNKVLAAQKSFGSSGVKQTEGQKTDTATGDAMDVLNTLANNHKTKTEIMDFLNKNSGAFSKAGVNVNTLKAWADSTFQWDG